MRRKRRTKYTWLPAIGMDLQVTGAPEDIVAGIQFAQTVSSAGDSTVDIFPVTTDTPVALAGATTTDNMSEIMANDYFIRRIVGKLHASMRQKRNASGDPSSPQACLFGCGFFIARAADGGGTQQQPIGAATPAERRTNYSPLGLDTIREPWIWRRTWVLQNPAQSLISQANNVTSDSFDFAGFPTSTGGYGSVMDGPHIDAKTLRRVTNDDRLWFAFANFALPVGTTDQDGQVNGYLDMRLLGQLRKAKNRGVF